MKPAELKQRAHEDRPDYMPSPGDRFDESLRAELIAATERMGISYSEVARRLGWQRLRAVNIASGRVKRIPLEDAQDWLGECGLRLDLIIRPKDADPLTMAMPDHQADLMAAVMRVLPTLTVSEAETIRAMMQAFGTDR